MLTIDAKLRQQPTMAFGQVSKNFKAKV